MKNIQLHDLLSQDAPSAARQLIGWRLYVDDIGGIISETEAYNQDDAASHSYRGETPRTRVMFGPPGRMYVYFTYGMHWCMNIVTGTEGRGEAVLIRSITPDRGLDTIRQRRGDRPDHELTNGPAKLCQALAVTGTDNCAVINQSRFALMPPENGKPPQIQVTERIGIRHDTHRMWRFVATQSD
jgi:DNA-3-methyladenine glycosylase